MGSNLRELGRTSEAVNQRRAVKQHAGGQCAQHEVLETCFGGTCRVTVDGRQNIQRQRLKLEAHIEGDQVIGRDHQHHADGGEENKDRVFEALRAVPLHEADRQDECCGRTEQGQHFHDAREGVDHQRAVEGQGLVVGSKDHQQRRDRERHQSAERHHVGGIRFAEDAQHEERQCQDRQHDLRKGGHGVCLFEKPHWVLVLTAARRSPALARRRRPRSTA